MRTFILIISWIFISLGIICLMAATAPNVDIYTSLTFAITLLFPGLMFITALRKNYQGGAGFYAGICVIGFAICFGFLTYQFHTKHDHNAFVGGMFISVISLLAGLIFLWFGHQRHTDKRGALPDPHMQDTLESPVSPPALNPPDQAFELEPPVLNRPVALWKTFFLFFVSCGLYAIILIYRNIKDLNALNQTRLKAWKYAIGICIPFFSYILAYDVTKNIAALGKQHNLTFKFSPAVIVSLMVLANLLFLLPKYLFLLTLFLSTIPWLIIDRQMDAIKLSYSQAQWRPEQGFRWKQHALVLTGLVLLVFITLQNKREYQVLMAKHLDAGQYISGQSRIYQLQIRDAVWRQLPLGTLDTDTDLELAGTTPDQWILVRINPNQQHGLDTFVDQRKTRIMQQWTNINISERRNLNSGDTLIPISFAHYTGQEGAMNINKSLYVTTVATPERVIEVIGQGSKAAETEVQAVVESLQLTKQATKP